MDVDQYRPAKAEKWSKRDDSPDRAPASDAYRRRSPDRRERPRGTGRLRSRSPPAIDRYQPGRSRDEEDYNPSRERFRDRDDRRRPATPPDIDRYMPGKDDPLPPPVRANPLPNPLTLDYQVGFNWFAEWWRGEQNMKEDEERVKNGGRRQRRTSRTDSKEDREKERAQIQAAYDEYKEEFQARIAKAFVLTHKSQEWFKERYTDELRIPFRERLMRFRQGALDYWENDLASGTFDAFTLEGIYKTESNGAGGVMEREEGEAPAAAEVLGVGDLVPTRGGDIRDDAAGQPALLIKTLAPMVSREKIEEFCREHLGEQDGGFKWLSLSDPNPQKKCHRIGWIMLHSSPDGETRIIERGDGRDEDDMAVDVPSEEKSGQFTVTEKALDSVNSKTIADAERGDFTCHVGIHVPPRELRKKALWDLFSAPERIERDLGLAKRIVEKFDKEMGSQANGVEKVEQRVEALRSQGLLQDLAAENNQFKKVRTEGLADDPEDLEKEEGEEDESAVVDEIDDENLLVTKKTLDLLVEYLRRVYNFCLFCVFESDSVHELVRKCPGGHLRRPRASLGNAAITAARASAAGEAFPLKRRESVSEEMLTSPVEEKKPIQRSKQEIQLQRAFNWVKTYEEKLLQILEPEDIDIKKLGGMPLEEGLDEELKRHVKQEDEAKFRCKVPECTKLFRTEAFWRKHVEKRHEEFFENVKIDLSLINAYLLDPAHIAPSRTDAQSNGHFPVSNSQLHGGTPRGFNLSNMPMVGFGAMPGSSSFANFGMHAVSMPGGWSSMDGGGRMPGPMRRGRGGNMQNRMPGPYDRRGPRYGNGAGLRDRGSMDMGMGMGAGNKGWDGGMGQGGPREAVQGRQLKSYEDLDAVGGGGGGELDY